MGYYDGGKLLEKKDLDGLVPEIFICTSNRSAGKSVYFSKKLVDEFLEKKEKFLLLYRYKYELCDCGKKFFATVKELFYSEKEMTSKNKQAGTYAELYLDGELCGYATAINCAEKVKNVSNLLSDAKKIFFDEFQSEQGNYTKNEVQKFISIHTSVARGGGARRRYLPVYLVGNLIDVNNPYYMALGITKRLNDDTNFLRGRGWILEQGWNEESKKEQQLSRFMQAFQSSAYVKKNANEKGYLLNDGKNIVKKAKLKECLFALKVEEKIIGIWSTKESFYYCVENAQSKKIYAMEMEEVEEDAPLLPNELKSFLIKSMTDGILKYSDEEVKKIVKSIYKRR